LATSPRDHQYAEAKAAKAEEVAAAEVKPKARCSESSPTPISPSKMRYDLKTTS